MISENKIKSIIEEVLSSMKSCDASSTENSIKCSVSDENLCDLAAVNLRKELSVPTPANKDAYLKLKASTPARIGIWRTGPRYLTKSFLRFRADHAVAQDAVFKNVPEEFAKDWGIPEVKTMCSDKDQFLTRPDLGRKFDGENAKIIKSISPDKPRVQIYVADGLSSTAVETNAKDVYQSMVQGLKGHNIESAQPFFVRYGRVPSMDAIGEILESEVTVVLIGERPGLATGESLSCYIAYKASSSMPEANRTVISNIHDSGTPAVEAGAHVADIIKAVLEQKASGINLKI